jgi:hypothetical protein
MTRQEAAAELSEDKRIALAVSDLTWIWPHEAWGSKQRRQIFAHDWIKKRSLEEIRSALATRPAGSAEWSYFFTQMPPAAVLATIVSELE